MADHGLDVLDRKILRRLQEDCRRPAAEIADAVGLSKSACHRRIQLLERRGIVERYAAIVKPKSLGYPLMFAVDITLRGQSDEEMSDFEKGVMGIGEIVECQLMTGQNDYALRVVARDVEDFEKIHHRLARLPGVATVVSRLALRTVKQSTGMPA